MSGGVTIAEVMTMPKIKKRLFFSKNDRVMMSFANKMLNMIGL